MREKVGGAQPVTRGVVGGKRAVWFPLRSGDPQPEARVGETHLPFSFRRREGAGSVGDPRTC